MNEKIDMIEKYIKGVFSQPGSHGLDHVLRVVYLCEVIGKEENADMMVLLPAAFFHDIARPIEMEKGMPHEEVGARTAERYLRSVKYDEERIPKITHAIRTHRYRSIEKPETLEAADPLGCRQAGCNGGCWHCADLHPCRRASRGDRGCRGSYTQ